VTLTQPADGASVTTPTPAFGGTAGSASGDTATVTVKLYVGSAASGTPVQTLTATRGADNSYSVTAAHLDPGTYTAQAEQRDGAGNTGLSAPSTFAVKTIVVSLTFNDGSASQYTYARPALRAHNMNATFYVASGWIGTLGGYMSWNQLDTLYRDGNEIGGMTTDHVELTDPTKDFDYKKQQVCGDHDRLAQHGYDPKSFAYPGAAVNFTFPDGTTAEQLVASCGYLSGRSIGGLSTTGKTAENVPPADPFWLSTPSLDNSGITLQALEDTVTAAAGQGGWVPIAFNALCDQGDANYSSCMNTYQAIDAGVFSQFLDWLQASGQPGGAPAGIDVRTIRQVMNTPSQPPLSANPTIVSLTFNDAIANQYTYARPALLAHNMNGTFYVPSGWVSNLTGYMSWGQLDTLYRDGNEIGGMGSEHLDLTDPTKDFAYKKQEVCGERDRLVGLGYDPKSFAYPAAAVNFTFPDGSTVEQLVASCGYLSGRSIGGLSIAGKTAERLPPADAFWLSTMGMSNSAITLQALKDAVTAAAEQGGGWVPIAFNGFCHQGDANYSSCISSTNQPIDDAVFSQFLDWLQAAGQPGGAPAGVQVQTVRKTMGSPLQPPLPTRPTVVSITFDDGAASQYDVRSMLASHGMHGTFYINSGKVGSDATYMTWSQIQDLYADGNEIGGHTVLHSNLAQVDANEATREICYDRKALLGRGYPVSDLAYPYGAYNANVESIAQACGYNSARTTGTFTAMCPFTCAEPIPAKDAFATRIISVGTEDAATLEQRVVNAEQNGGGWVQLLFHEVCDGCDADATPPATLATFLDWLQPRAAAGTTVQTVQQVVGGTVKPSVSGPPIPPAIGTANGLSNASLEQDTNGDGVPDCFDTESYGAEKATWTRTTDAHTGSFAERVDVTDYTNGANKLNVSQDLGFCTPTVQSGHTYRVSAWYKSTAPVNFVIERRNSTSWVYSFWRETTTFAATSTWQLATFTTPQVPNGVNGLTFGLSLAGNGSLTVDDISIVRVS
jgi:peptidoglycan/xylan/chitin deacetylase (PgdA/CDA1 family)